MFSTLRKLLDQLAGGDKQPPTGHALQLAGTALLLEIARADETQTPAERRAVVDAARRVFDLDATEVDDLLAAADAAVEQSVSLFDFTSAVNAALGREARETLIEELWRVAHADGRIDRYEEYYLRKIADLLHVSHSAFIRAKLKIEGA